ncbi:DUF3043 domain-containing protein [Mycolicibacterium brumae]|uniref:DUF3043 domain-containing protein n=1 Tax=Mycolicibacterium brumae TaxID=85968 RepID=A0A2G5P5X6_9MYCO|nr:DUF3043 domain-containing protein [Mycolicibacterium brumae]PIB73695.1 DUF3043 domain-containing protein [Mycolicibacterium brumae]RWA19573.1 hypothetical protein MBRU_16580 [Mycolicibacterium brumae DSM 44177]UWW08341.1 DUF3043 domain-containing protein [Mycolicibacterium brumae]
MSLLGRKKAKADAPETVELTESSAVEESTATPRVTPPKGRPTPKRDQGRRGPVAPAPQNMSEARARRKQLKGPKLSKEERKVARMQRRAQMDDRRSRMMAGEEKYLLPRDQGPVRRYVRDIVDSRRFSLLGLFMWAALAMLMIMFAMPQQFAVWGSTPMLALMLLMLGDALVLGRNVSRRVDEKFPDNTERKFRLGLYAAGRASQLRKMRAPKPMVNRGDVID